MSDSDLARFWKCVDVGEPDECWMYKPGTSRYGTFAWNNKARGAHRFAWEINNGSIPSGMDVMHKCDNPRCVNPNHLALGTHAENMRDMVKRRRSATGDRNGMRKHPEKISYGDKNGMRIHPEVVRRGEGCPFAKLTGSEVSQIRIIYEKYGLSFRDIATKYNVHRETIRRIIRRHIWTHIP